MPKRHASWRISFSITPKRSSYFNVTGKLKTLYFRTEHKNEEREKKSEEMVCGGYTAGIKGSAYLGRFPVCSSKR
jgi:hypothetical protein